MRSELRSISEFAPLLVSRAISSEALTQACLEQIRLRDPDLNAFITVFWNDALQQAAGADRELATGRHRGPLHGIPISVKDLIDLRDAPTTAASKVRAGHVARADAPVIARLREAGAVFVGKCNLHEFAFGTTNEESAYGPTRNPHDRSRSPGGSSGGSAVSVATGMAVASVGSDTGGSIRIPSAACGTVGLKPAYGEVPCDGVVPLSPSLDHVGPISRTVGDAWLLYRIMAGDTRPAPLTADQCPDASALRLAAPRPYFLDLLDSDVRGAFDAGLARLRGAGARVREAVIPHAEDTAAIYLHIVLPEAAVYHARTLETTAGDYTPGVRLRLEMGRYVLAEDYLRALEGRRVLRREVDAALEGHDALVLPTLPIPAPPLGASVVAVGSSPQPVRNVMLRLTQLFNLTGHPAVSLPCGATSQGLPCGLQLVGAHGGTAALVRVAHTCEQIVRHG